jgi:hypothetical protein
LKADISWQLEEIDPQAGSQIHQTPDHEQDDSGDHQKPG